MLAELQSLLEGIYRVEVGLDVQAFTIGARELGELSAAGARALSASEQLLVVEDDDGEGARLALFIDDAVLSRLRASEPAGLGAHNLDDFCLLAEGVSHFVYLAWKASRDEPVTQLELELQAEVDKYVACFVACWEQDNGRFPADLKASLFQRVRFRDDLSADEHDRYRTANGLALRYCDWLERSFLRAGGLQPAMPELRRFYRMTHGRKLDHIAAR